MQDLLNCFHSIAGRNISVEEGMNHRNFAAWFSCMPGVTVQFLTISGPACALLVHPDMQPALVNLETGDFCELDANPADPFMVYQLQYEGWHPWRFHIASGNL